MSYHVVAAGKEFQEVYHTRVNGWLTSESIIRFEQSRFGVRTKLRLRDGAFLVHHEIQSMTLPDDLPPLSRRDWTQAATASILGDLGKRRELRPHNGISLSRSPKSMLSPPPQPLLPANHSPPAQQQAPPQPFSLSGYAVSTSNMSAMQYSAGGGTTPLIYQGHHQHGQNSMEGESPPLNTPWTLGSTDGSLAIQIALVQQQQNQVSPEQHAREEIPASPVGAAISPSGEAASVNSAIITTSSVSTNTGTTQSPLPSGPGNEKLTILSAKRSLYQDRLFKQPSSSVESVLAASCEVMGFDIAEMWLRTGAKTHQLTNSHLRPTALEDSVRKDLVEVYYGEKSSERTHRLSPALCKRAKEAGDVVWVTAHTSHGAEALRCSISNVRTAVAIPVCHEASNTNITIIFFSIRR